MMRKWLEDWHDTLMYVGVLIGMLLFFLLYWKAECQVRIAEVVLDEFLSKVSISGKITLEDYEILMENMEKVNSKYEVNIRCIEYQPQPVYAIISEEKLAEYYLNRNIKEELPFDSYEIPVEEEPVESLQLQTETNASVMAAEQGDYISLPEETTVWKAEAARPFQEVYEGEALITICRVFSPNGIYYAEAEPVNAISSGTVLLNLILNEKTVQVPVEILCHPRIAVCSNGHEIVNSVNRLEEEREYGRPGCPHCKIIPQSVICNTAVIQKETGQNLTKEDIWITVEYMDGHVEQITPESGEWQDNYDLNYCGIQQVEIRYRGKEDMVIVISENEGCRQCGAECNERCYADYKRFPYCTECMSKVPLFSGKVYEEEIWRETGEVIAFLDENGEMVLEKGTYVSVCIFNNKTYVTNLQREIMQDGRAGKK